MLSKTIYVLTPMIALAAGLLGFYLLMLAAGLNTVTYSFLIGFPFVAGVVILYFRPKGTFIGLWNALFYMIATMILSIIGAFALGIEGLVCIAMALAPFVFGLLLGGLFYLLLLRMYSQKTGSVKVFSLPAILLLLLLQPPTPTRVFAISNSVIIDASPEVVFALIQNIPNVTADEFPTKPSHLLGIPKPTSARWEESPQGPVRHSYWGEGVHFIEIITGFEENRSISWDFVFPEDWIVEGIEDPHIRVGGPYLDILRGGYVLEDLGTQTRLTLTTHTLDSSGLGAYAKFWHHFFFEDFHEGILAVVKTRSEQHAATKVSRIDTQNM